MRESSAHELSLKAIADFNEGRISDAVEKVYEIEGLISVLSQKKIRRFIARMLNVVAELRKKVARQDALLEKLSGEFVEMGYMSLQDDKNLDASMANFEKALDIYPENTNAELGVAKCLSVTGQYKKALKLLNKIIKRKPRLGYEALMLKGDILALENDYAGAALNYQAAAKVRPQDEEAIQRIIAIYEKAGLDDLADQWRGWLDNKNPEA